MGSTQIWTHRNSPVGGATSAATPLTTTDYQRVNQQLPVDKQMDHFQYPPALRFSIDYILSLAVQHQQHTQQQQLFSPTPQIYHPKLMPKDLPIPGSTISAIGGSGSGSCVDNPTNPVKSEQTPPPSNRTLGFELDDTQLRRKKTRTVFTKSQIMLLESAFNLKRYLNSCERSHLASSLHLTEAQVKIWFQNRRNKLKREPMPGFKRLHPSSFVWNWNC